MQRAGPNQQVLYIHLLPGNAGSAIRRRRRRQPGSSRGREPLASSSFKQFFIFIFTFRVLHLDMVCILQEVEEAGRLRQKAENLVRSAYFRFSGTPLPHHSASCCHPPSG